MTYEVELMTFGKGQIRPVELPEGTVPTLDMIYSYGQNSAETRHLGMPSVSMGDIIHFEEKQFIVKDFGFEELDALSYNCLKLAMWKAVKENRRYTDILWEQLGKKALEYC